MRRYGNVDRKPNDGELCQGRCVYLLYLYIFFKIWFYLLAISSIVEERNHASVVHVQYAFWHCRLDLSFFKFSSLTFKNVQLNVYFTSLQIRQSENVWTRFLSQIYLSISRAS